MQKDEKFMQFQQAFRGNSAHAFNIDLGDINSPVERQPAPRPVAKNKSGVESFLESIDGYTFDLMRKYLRDNQDFLDKPVPPKIALYEDIKIIYEFKLGEAEIILNKGKGREAISEKLALVLRRSKATILDRMKKKLYKLTIEDIEYAIKNNAPFNFDKKDQRSKSTVPSVVNSRVDRSDHKRDRQEDDIKIITEEDELSKLGFGAAKPEIKFQPRKPKYGLSDLINDGDRHVVPAEKKRIYKYGKLDIKQKIFTYGTIYKRKVLCITESEAVKLRDKWTEQEKMKIYDRRMKTPEKPKEAGKKPQCKEEDSPPQSQERAPIPNSNEVLPIPNSNEVLPIPKSSEVLLIQKSEYEAPVHESKEEVPIPKIEEDQASKLEGHETVVKIQEKEEQTKQEEIQPPNEDKQDKQFPTVLSFMHKLVPPPSPEPPKEEFGNQEELNTLLYKLNNNEQNLQRLINNPQLRKELVWSQEEDDLLFQFCFKPEQNKLGIICLLRYKTLDQAIERYSFLNMNLDGNARDELFRLAGRIGEPMDIV